MLTAAVAGTDLTSSAQLQAWLLQTGLVSSVQHWTVSFDRCPEIGESVPDVVFLDITRDPEPHFALAAQLRRLRPNVCLVACYPAPQPDPEVLLNAMRAGVQDVLPKPVDLQLLEGVLARFARELQQSSDLRTTGKLFVAMGAKGGVGTTTVAVNLGTQLAEFARDSVVLLDFGRPLGMAQLMLDLKPRFSMRDAVENLDRLDSHFFTGLLTRHATSLQVLAGASQLEHWQDISSAALQRVINVALSTFEIVLVDYGSQFSSEWAPVLKQASILLIAEANVPSLWALERRLFALAGFGVSPERIRTVINRWHRRDESTLKSVEKNIKRPIFACLPNDFSRISDSITVGVPLTTTNNNLLAGKFRDLAAQLAGIAPDQGKRNSLTTLFPSRR